MSTGDLIEDKGEPSPVAGSLFPKGGYSVRKLNKTSIPTIVLLLLFQG
ncbi:MAG: hypothetical protein IPM91_07300 [Bacteroidetes bacterium]|nr:hypothetical protein [Bacteroidota bacterium]